MASSNISQVLEQATQKISPFHGSARLDAEVLVAYALAYSRTQLYTWSDKVISESEIEAIDKLVNRRCGGEPVAYIVGSQEFWSLNFKVTSDTLIPRPETELLVEFALDNMPVDRQFKILDLGTGTGAIAITLAKERPKSQVVAIDNSHAALKVAIENAKILDVSNIAFERSNWFDSLDGSAFDMIISNPPYIEESDKHLCQGDVSSEPRSALVSGVDGLDDISKIIGQGKDFLRPGAILVFEHGWNQSGQVRELFRNALYEEVSSYKDLAGIERITVAKNNKLIKESESKEK